MKNNIRISFALLFSLFIFNYSFAGPTEDLWKALKEANYPNALTAIAAGADVKNLDATFGTPLNFASCWADADVVKALIDAKSDVNLGTPSNGYYPLMNAAHWGNVEAVKLLLAAGADIKIKNKMGQTLLSVAVGGSKLETLKLLLAAGADPKEKFDYSAFKGWTVMNSLTQANEPAEKVISLQGNSAAFTKIGVALPPRLANAQESDYSSLEEMTKFLLEKGADPNNKTVLPATSLLDQAISAGKIGMAKALIDNGAAFDPEMNVQDKNYTNGIFPNLTYTNGDYVLVAILSNNFDFVKFMIEKNPKAVKKAYTAKGAVKCNSGSQTSNFTVEGMNLLMIAAERGNVEIVKYLIAKGFDKDDVANAEWGFVEKKQGHCPMLTVRRTMGFARNSGKQEIIDLVKAAGHAKE